MIAIVVGLNSGLDVDVNVNRDENEIGIGVGVSVGHAYVNVNATPGIENGNGNWVGQALRARQHRHQEPYSIYYYSRHNRGHQHEAPDSAMSALPHMVHTQFEAKADTSTQINVGMRMEQGC